MSKNYIVLKAALYILAGLLVYFGVREFLQLIPQSRIIVEEGGRFSSVRMFYDRFPKEYFVAFMFSAYIYFVAAFLVLCLSFLHIGVAYWGIQATLWCVSFRMWYQDAYLSGGGALDNILPFNIDATRALLWFVATFVCSLIVFVLYKFAIDKYLKQRYAETSIIANDGIRL